MLTRWYNEQKSWRLKRSQIWCGLLQLCGSTMLRWFRAYCRNPPNKSAPWQTSARVKSYQLLKVVSGGRAPGKSSSLASSQLLVIERFHCFRAVRLESVHFWVSRWFLKLIFVHSFKRANAGCCLLAACLLLACCCLPAACLLLLACCLLLLLAAPAAAVAACLCCLPLLLLASAACLCCLPACLLLACCCCCSCCCLLLLAAACLLREVRAGDASRERECFWLVGMKHCGCIARLFRCAHHLHHLAPFRKTPQTARQRKTEQTQQMHGAAGAPTRPATLSARNGMKGFIPTRNRWVDRTTNFLRAAHDLDAHRASHRFGCGKQGACISLYHARS